MESVLHFTLTPTAENGLRLALSGELTRTTLTDLVKAFNTALDTPHISQISVCTQDITHWDSAGLIQLNDCIKKNQKSMSCTLEPLSTNLQSLWLMVSDTQYKQDIIPEKTALHGVEGVGETVTSWLKAFRLCAEYIGEMILCLWSFMKHPKNLDFKKVLYYMQEVGPNSLPLAFLIGILFGLIMAFQSAGLLRHFGAEIYVANLVAVALVKELGPLLMAIILTGRIASAYAAEIGAMQVNQEVDALRVMGLDPIPYLVLPRLIATALIAPFIALFMDLFGLLGCDIVMVSEDFNQHVIIKQMFHFLNMEAFVTSFIKSIVFGFLIAGIGCFHGLNSARNAASVGASTTQTMVSCIAIVTTVDGIFTTLLFYLRDIT